MTQVTITVDDSHMESIGTVARSLEATGMRVDRVNAKVGMITGSVDSAAEKALATVPGVASVDRSLTHQLLPPDSAVQ